MIGVMIFWVIICLLSLAGVKIMSKLLRNDKKKTLKKVFKFLFSALFLISLLIIVITLIQIAMAPNIALDFQFEWISWIILGVEAFVLEIYLIEKWWQEKDSILKIVGLIITGAFLTLCWLLVSEPAQMELFPLETRIQNKIKELSNLRKRLTAKQEEVSILISNYQMGISNIKQEIIDESTARNIATFEQARVDSRISYDLSLIQSKQAYILKLMEIKLKLQIGTNELEYLERKASDDLAMAKVLRNKDTEKLVETINKVIKKYMPDASQLVINIDKETLQTPEQIWDDIARGR